MNRRLLTACLATSLLVPAVASANPEPTAYDARSIAMGLTGTTYMDRASALVLNPANLDGIETLGFTLHFTGLFTKQRAPVQGPNTKVDSGLGFGPIPSGFIGGRIAPRVVFAAGLYIETGYGSSFDNVTCLDGAPVTPNPQQPQSPDTVYVPDTNPDTCTNGAPQNLDVTFFVGEFSTGFSIRAHEKFQLGLALRLPFSKQTASLYQNLAPGFPGYVPGSAPNYDRVKNNIGGIGFPSLRAGFTIKPHPKVRLSAMFRMYSRVKLTGTTKTGQDGLELDALAYWNIPNALQFGISYQPIKHLLLALEARRQWHAASRTGNLNQTVIASLADGTPLTTLVVPFGWKNVWSLKVGLEYRFTKDVLALRLGANFANAATSGEWAQYFTPPPAPFNASTVMGGLGFYWDDRNDPNIKDKYQLDIGGLFAWSGQTIGNRYISNQGTVPGTVQEVRVCSGDQVVRTGCPGQYRVFTYWASVSFSLQY
jgi:hypothetical protein